MLLLQCCCCNAAAAMHAGGKVGVKMAAKPELVDAVCAAHPGLIKVRNAAAAAAAA
jgi:hypothetical protein